MHRPSTVAHLLLSIGLRLIASALGRRSIEVSYGCMGQSNVASILTANSSNPGCLVVGAIGATTGFLGILRKFDAKSNRRECKYDVQAFGEGNPGTGLWDVLPPYPPRTGRQGLFRVALQDETRGRPPIMFAPAIPVDLTPCARASPLANIARSPWPKR